MTQRIQLLGRFTIKAEVRALSGLAIGAGDGFRVGADQAVVRDALSGEPYIPGSSLKGKLRALTERALGAPLVSAPGGGGPRDGRSIHRCTSEKDYRSGGAVEGYAGCPVCHLYGNIPLEFPVLPTRLVTRDARLTDASRQELSRRRTELPFTEVKVESLLDRLTAAATPRHRERVPAGAAFEARWDLSAYAVDGADLRDDRLLPVLFAGLRLLEEDYLGGQGSRGYGRVEIAALRVEVTHDGGLSGEARELAEKVASAGSVAGALEATGNPLARGAA